MRQVRNARITLALLVGTALTLWTSRLPGGETAKIDRLALEANPHASFTFGGLVGQRIRANVDGWLLPCPGANPGLIEMFRVRDRQPVPQLVPWAGEFVGKYLISGIQALRMTHDPRLEASLRRTVEEVIATQADDGYLGPFPKQDRLRGNWDLWGHYHVMQALELWHERTGDENARRANLKAADLICATYLDQGRSLLEAGSPEMNLAVIHVLGRLYRATGNERYLRQMQGIVRDFEGAGDYYRTGKAGVPFFRTPRPRWESLHDLQGLVELYRITGDESYRDAFVNLWRSIRDWDRRNGGGFSSGEQATGSPYEPSAIETCCTIAWMAVTIDALALTGDSTIADELELSTYNGMLGAQHPSGRWWTYNTPMDGAREASAHTIVFQSRAGTPELNCCSVNAPRGLGMLSEWAVMQCDGGLAVNYYGPFTCRTKLADGTGVAIEQHADYPRSRKIELSVKPDRPQRFKLRVRVPQWSPSTSIKIGDKKIPATAGSYAQIDRTWEPGDTIEIGLDLAPRYEVGDLQQAGKASIYYGPLLLAYDQALNDFDEEQIPTLEGLKKLLLQAEVTSPKETGNSLAPWLVAKLPVGNDKTLALCDFASAGAQGTRYRSWLKAAGLEPPAVVVDSPVDGGAVPPGRLLFTWRPQAPGEGEHNRYRVVVAESRNLKKPVFEYPVDQSDRAVVPRELAAKLKPGQDYFWDVFVKNAQGESRARNGLRQFHVDSSLAPYADADLTTYGEGPEGILVDAPLATNAEPQYGALDTARDVRPTAAGPGLDFNGRSSLAAYKLKRFPERDYTLAVWFRLPAELPPKLMQLASGWVGGGDDPLRLCVDHGRLFARIENPKANLSTPGLEVEHGDWHHVAAVKAGERLTLYLDGQERATLGVPAVLQSSTRTLGFGGNPRFTGDEYLLGTLRGGKLYARALSPAEVQALAAKAE